MIAIVKYDAGNVRSLINAIRRLGVTEWDLTSDPERLRAADKVLLPGVGDASVAIASLRSSGLEGVIKSLERPVLGICVGMQILCRHCDEGDTDGFGIFRADVSRFEPIPPEVKVPHMGWNRIGDLKTGLFKGLSEGTFMYFVHSYRAGICPDTIARSIHGDPFSAALRKDNFFGTQFHPEKSGPEGAILLKNYLEL